MNCKCKPQLNVISAVDAAGTLTLTVDRLLTTLGSNTCFCLCISRAMIPAASTSQVVITDGTTTDDVFRCDGNFVRADSLRSFLCKNACGCCPAFNFNAFIGNDPDHITIFNRMCPSAFVPVVAAG